MSAFLLVLGLFVSSWLPEVVVLTKFLNVCSISDPRIQDQFKQKGFSMLLCRIINRVEVMALFKKEK